MAEEVVVPLRKYFTWWNDRLLEIANKNPWMDGDYNSCALASHLGVTPAGLTLTKMEERAEEETIAGSTTTTIAGSTTTTIVTTPGTVCYWEKIGNNVWYKPGDVYVKRNLNVYRGETIYGQEGVFLKLINKTDEAVDPTTQYGVGLDPILRWTHGLDVSLNKDWLLCAGDILTDTVTEEIYTLTLSPDGYVVVCDTDNYRIKKHLATDGTYQAKIGSIGSGDDQFNTPWGICSDGAYVYVADDDNDRIKKHFLSNLSFVAKIGSHGSGNDNFNIPRGICTDGTWLYVVDRNNNRVVKRLCSDLSYVAQTAGPGFNQPNYICTDGTYVYTVQTSGATYRIFKHYCDDLSLDLRVMPAGTDGHINSATITGICTTGGYLYLINSNLGSDPNPFYKYSCLDLTYVTHFGTYGTGDGEINNPQGIATDGTNLWVSDSNGIIDSKINKFLLDGTYISHFGVYGNADDAFWNHRGLCISGILVRTTFVPRRGPILRAHADADACESYVSFHFRNNCKFLENSVGNANYISIQAPASVTNYDLVLPGAQSSGAQFLRNDGAGVLTWVTALTSVTAHNILSATHGDSLTGTVVLGDIVHGNVTPKWAKLAGNTTAVKQYLSQTGTGSVSAVPAWATIAQADVTGLKTTDGPSFDHLHLTVAIGTAPLVVTSTTVVSNLNANLLQGNLASVFEPALGNPGTSGWVLSSTDVGVRSWVAQSGGAASFVDLDDVPATYAGAGGYVVKVKADASGLEFIAGGAGVSSFNDLDDVPASYVGQEGKYVKVNATANGLEYATVAGGDHALLSATHTDTTAAAVARGSLIVGIGASPKWEAYAKGAVNQVLGGDGTDSKWVTACPVAAKYIVGAVHADLSAEKVKAQLYNNYDLDDTPGSPNALDDEFDNSSLDGKWTITNNPAGADALSETAFPGFVWIGLPESAATDDYLNLVRLHQAAPAGNAVATYVAKISLGMINLAGSDSQRANVGIYIGTVADKEMVAMSVQLQSSATEPGFVNAFHTPSTGTITAVTTIESYTIPVSKWFYLKLEKSTNAAYTSANTYNMYYSLNGIIWVQVGTMSKTFSNLCDEVGVEFRLPITQTGTAQAYAIVDFFRRTV